MYSGETLNYAASQAAMPDGSDAARPHMICLQRHCTHTGRLITWRVNELDGAQWRSCHEDGLLGFLLLSVRPCPDFLITDAYTSKGRPSFHSFASVRFHRVWRCPHIAVRAAIPDGQSSTATLERVQNSVHGRVGAAAPSVDWVEAMTLDYEDKVHASGQKQRTPPS